ncbi:MAG: tetratricopeptide repeat protein [Clostridiales bacterium]|nr:tetratricopeptide repeat protein [Clostridiales bacterium]
MFNLGCAYEELGYLERAAAMYSDSASRLSLVEGENLTFAERINNLAAVLIRLGLVEPAFFMLGNVAAIRRRELGVHSPKYADSLYNLANAAADVGRRKDSLSYHTEALRIRQNEGHTKDIIHSLHSIAFLHESAAEYEKAVPYAETAVKHSIGDDRAYAESCNYLAGLYENCNKFEAALPLYEQVLEITNETVGSEHSAYLNIALRRAHLLSLMNRPHEALVAHEDVCSAFTRVSGTRHIFYANCLRGMAMIHKNLKNPDRAEELILEAMKIRRVMYEDITLDITFLIHLHLQENNPVKALEALIYALMCSGNNSPEFSELLDTLVDLFSKNKTSATVEFINSMEMLNDKEKLRPIIDKWENWEKGNV